MDKKTQTLVLVILGWLAALGIYRYAGLWKMAALVVFLLLIGYALPWAMNSYQNWPTFFKRISWQLPGRVEKIFSTHPHLTRVAGWIAGSARWILVAAVQTLKDTGVLLLQFARWFRIWFPKQRLAVKVGVCIGIALFVTWLSYFLLFSCFTEKFEPLIGSDQAPCVLGAPRVTMTATERDERTRRMIETRTFWVLQDDQAVPGFDRVMQYRGAIERAAAKFEIDPDDIEAVLELESQGRIDVKSPTGPTGIAQLTKQTAINLGLTVNTKRDDRLDPELSIFAAAKLLRELENFFGRSDFAIAAYHSGQKRVANLVKVYLSPKTVTTGGKSDIAKYGLTYSDVYFRCTPYVNSATYAEILRLFREVDNGPNYWFKVECVKKLFTLRRKDKQAFLALAAKQKFEGRRATNRMWTFYGENDEAFVTLGDLKKALSRGQIVAIPNDPKFGFRIRTEGKDAVGQLDADNREYYMASKPETAGCLLYIAQKLHELRQGHSPLQLEITSITRTVEYQKRLSRINPVATKKLSFHVLGLAFDITRNGHGERDLRDIQFVLEELDSTGFISWVPENAAFHVVVAPNDEGIKFFTGVYIAAKGYRSNLIAALP